METILVTANVVLAIVLVLIILLQRSEGGALGLGVSQDNFASTRAVGSFLTKLTGIAKYYYRRIASCQGPQQIHKST